MIGEVVKGFVKVIISDGEEKSEEELVKRAVSAMLVIVKERFGDVGVREVLDEMKNFIVWRLVEAKVVGVGLDTGEDVEGVVKVGIGEKGGEGRGLGTDSSEEEVRRLYC